MAGLRQTLGHAGIYGTGNALQNLVGFIMLPIYTRYLTPADYGTLSILQIALDIAALTFGLRLGMGVFRNYFAAPDEAGRNRVISSALVFSVGLQAVAAGAVGILSGPLSTLLFGSREFQGYLALFAWSLVGNSLFFVPFQYLRATERPVAFVGISLAKLLLQLSLNILLVVHYRMGVMGVILSNLATAALLGLPLAFWALWRTRFSVSVNEAKLLASYSWPLVLDGFVNLAVTGGSRAALGRVVGLDEVGRLSLGARFAEALDRGIVRPFNSAWGPQRFREAKRADGAVTFSRAFMLISLAIVVPGTALSVFAKEILRIMSAPAFWGAATIVPVLVINEALHNAMTFARFGLVLEGRTVEFLKASLAGAVVATFAWFLLVPRWGAVGAAGVLVVFSLGKLLWLARQPKSSFDVSLPWRRFASLLFMGGATSAAASLAPDEWLPAVSYKSLLLAVFAAVVFWSPVVGASERRATYQLARDSLRWAGRKVGRRSPSSTSR